MGQYHKIYNIDKKQYIHPHRVGNGLKLMEQVGFEKSTSTALFLLLANSNGRGGGDANDNALIGSWAGDRIVIQGDYAEPGDPGYITFSKDADDEITMEEWKDISNSVREMLDSEFGGDPLTQW